MAEPDFTVVIPTWNRPRMLARALDSVLAQQGPSFEIVVADDGAGEGAAMAQGLGVAGASGFVTGGLGQVPARTMAVRRARGRWIACLDDDDWWAAPDYLAGMKATLEGHGGLAYASGRIVRESASLIAESEIPFAAHADREAIRHNNILLVSGIAYETALHDRFGAFDETLPIYWDWDWYLRLAAACVPFVATGRDSVRISTRSDNVTAGNATVRAAELARLCRKHGLVGVVLKNHESIALAQQGGTQA